jgi:RNA polymerase sigma factor (sigma-70 family)
MGAAPDPRLTLILQSTSVSQREEAWTSLIQDYSGLLLHAARSLGGDQDVVMDRYTFILESLRADGFRRLRAYVADGGTKLSTWLIVVSTRLCLDDHRRRYGRSRPSQRNSLEDAAGHDGSCRQQRKALVDLSGTDVDPADLPDDHLSSDPEQQLRGHELSGALQEALATLAPQDRLLLRLRFDDGLSVPRIAALMGFPTPFHAYRRLTQLFGQLRPLLKARGVEDSMV